MALLAGATLLEDFAESPDVVADDDVTVALLAGETLLEDCVLSLDFAVALLVTFSLLAGVPELAGVFESLETAELLLAKLPLLSLDVVAWVEDEDAAASLDTSTDIPGLSAGFSLTLETESSESHEDKEMPMAKVKQDTPKKRIHTSKFFKDKCSFFNYIVNFWRNYKKIL